MPLWGKKVRKQKMEAKRTDIEFRWREFFKGRLEEARDRHASDLFYGKIPDGGEKRERGRGWDLLL